MKNTREAISLLILVFCLCSQTVFAIGISQATIPLAALGIVGARPYNPFGPTSPEDLNYSSPIICPAEFASSGLISISVYNPYNSFELLWPYATDLFPPIDVFTIPAANTSGFIVTGVGRPPYSPGWPTPFNSSSAGLEIYEYLPGAGVEITEGVHVDRRLLWGGGLEIIEFLPDGSRILLGDATSGATPGYPPGDDPPVYPPDAPISTPDPPDPPDIPEPATIVLLGLAGLTLCKRRRL